MTPLDVLRAFLKHYHPHGPPGAGLRTIYTQAAAVVHQIDSAPPAITVPRAALEAIVAAMGEAEAFMAGFVGDDTQEEPVDGTVERLSDGISTIETLLANQQA